MSINVTQGDISDFADDEQVYSSNVNETMSVDDDSIDELNDQLDKLLA